MLVIFALFVVSCSAQQFFPPQNFPPQQPPQQFPPQPNPNFFPPQPQNPNQIECGFTCTRKAAYSVSIDGTWTNVKCTDNNADPRVRCEGCCASRALAAGLPTTNAASFPSTNNKDCICCIYNNQCFGNNGF